MLLIVTTLILSILSSVTLSTSHDSVPLLQEQPMLNGKLAVVDESAEKTVVKDRFIQLYFDFESDKREMNFSRMNQASQFRYLPQIYPEVFLKENPFFQSSTFNPKQGKPFSEPSPPWFMAIKRSCKNRLSAWKDGNSIYASRLTYQ